MNIFNAKKKSQRIRRERTFLFIYALAITGALFVSIYHNNTVKASMPSNISMFEQAPEEFEDIEDTDFDGNFKTDSVPFEEDLISDISSAEVDEQMTEASEDKPLQETIVIQKGDSFISVLTQKGLSYKNASNLYESLKKVYDARNIRVGQEIKIVLHVPSEDGAEPQLERMEIEPKAGTRFILEKEDDSYQARVEQDEFVTEVKTIKGIINGNVSSAMSAAGVPANIIGNFINIFSFSVDFRRDVKLGDVFELKYEREIAPDGKVIKTGDILYASLQLGKDKTELYRFKDKNGAVDYYDEKGLALKKSLDRKPMEFKRARISSRFGRRFHPILKTYRNHDGVDYAAPSGSKVYASGDGVVKMAKWYGGYGNYISIRHNSEYSTGYGHLKSFAKGIRPGVRVKQGQLIAYVGNTGRSTGPHLHFEIVKNGKKVDPLKIKAATGENLSGERLRQFKKIVADIKKLDTPDENVEVVQNDTQNIDEMN